MFNKLKNFHKNVHTKSPKVKKAIGIVLILYGIFALITPFTPGSWLAFIGLELLGVKLAFWEKIKSRFISEDKSS